MGVLKHHPRLRWVPHDFFALEGLLKSFEVHRIAQIVLVAQYIGDGRCVPVVWVVEVTPARSACPLVSQHPRSKDLQLSQVPGDFAGAVAFSGHLEDQPDNWSGFRVNGQMAFAVSQIAVGGLCGDPLTAHALGPKYRPDLLAGVLSVPLVDDVAERGEVVVLPLAVHAVVDRDKPHIVLREADLCVHPYLQVVAAETGHILDDDRADEAAFNIGQHLLEARPVKVRTGVAVILVYPVIRDPMVSGVFGQDSDLCRFAFPLSLAKQF